MYDRFVVKNNKQALHSQIKFIYFLILFFQIYIYYI